MYKHRFEVIGWVLALAVVGVMGALVAFGPFHNINRGAEKSIYKPVHVSIVNDPKIAGRYVPSTVTVHVGQQVIFKNVSDVAHTVTGRADNSFDSKDIPVGSTWTFTARAPGANQYYCVYHPNMLGAVLVKSETPKP